MIKGSTKGENVKGEKGRHTKKDRKKERNTVTSYKNNVFGEKNAVSFGGGEMLTNDRKKVSE